MANSVDWIDAIWNGIWFVSIKYKQQLLNKIKSSKSLRELNSNMHHKSQTNYLCSGINLVFYFSSHYFFLPSLTSGPHYRLCHTLPARVLCCLTFCLRFCHKALTWDFFLSGVPAHLLINWENWEIPQCPWRCSMQFCFGGHNHTILHMSNTKKPVPSTLVGSDRPVLLFRRLSWKQVFLRVISRLHAMDYPMSADGTWKHTMQEHTV